MVSVFVTVASRFSLSSGGIYTCERTAPLQLNVPANLFFQIYRFVPLGHSIRSPKMLSLEPTRTWMRLMPAFHGHVPFRGAKGHVRFHVARPHWSVQLQRMMEEALVHEVLLCPLGLAETCLVVK